MQSKKIATIVSIIVGIVLLVGGHIEYHKNFATAASVQKIEQRLDLKILEDRASELRNRVWAIQDHWRGKTMPQTDLDEIRRLHDEREKILRKIERITSAGEKSGS